METLVKCLFCNSDFLLSTKHPNKKFCSTRCRDKHWVKNNPERDKLLKRRWYYKKPLLCLLCSFM